MLRTTVGVSFLVLFGAVSACSSKATDNNTTGGTGGNGALLGGNSSGGTSTTGNGAGTTSNDGGKSTTGGAANTGGLASGACTDETITCVDETQAMGCNTETGMVDTFSCVDEYAAIGFVASGCTMDPTGDFCDITSVSDTACQQGAQAFGRCEGATTDEQIFNIYVNCFTDFMDARTIIPCFAQYVSPAMMTANDCLQAEEACLPGAATGAGGQGAGGAP